MLDGFDVWVVDRHQTHINQALPSNNQNPSDYLVNGCFFAKLENIRAIVP